MGITGDGTDNKKECTKMGNKTWKMVRKDIGKDINSETNTGKVTHIDINTGTDPDIDTDIDIDTNTDIDTDTDIDIDIDIDAGIDTGIDVGLNTELILVLSDETLIGRAVTNMVREYGVYSEVLSYETAGTVKKIINKIRDKNLKGIILIFNTDAKTPFVSETKKKFAENKILKDIPIMEISKLAKETIKNFIFKDCNCSGDWNIGKFTEDAIKSIKKLVGNKKVLCGLSGGVDSSVAAVLLQKAVGKQLTCLFVDHGLLRKYEASQVEQVFRNKFDINLIKVDAKNRFLKKLAGVREPEKKRKIIGEEFIRIFEEEAKNIGAVDYLVQGTIYPDIIESGIGSKGTIKSHHNVGGLPSNIEFKGIIEPLKYLFKNEVRAVGERLGIPSDILWRQPFPGPGLAVRIIGEITEEKLHILREADYIFRDEIAKAGLSKDLSQYFAVLTDMRSVGIHNGERTYDYTIALRAIKTKDFMTADWVRLPYDVLGEIVYRIIDEVENVNRVVYDITAKPPATIEWE